MYNSKLSATSDEPNQTMSSTSVAVHDDPSVYFCEKEQKSPNKEQADMPAKRHDDEPPPKPPLHFVTR
eukprot:CAMPEP_0170829498 /NCGR_PEP_ID=MMETSP0733-20121128/48647_1 /TAXON_ID=186038 /ORGANISM="Fragilariopsis kerguelensis, Strain L26-C5" /LENGTH=67 /DNA_ID=CAMNT_0011194373 /DNA_START=209 /DNA_END=412 /DNA_ORIENTATION=-